MTDLPDFSQFCEAACIKIWGEPQLRTPKQLRWSGDKGDNGYGARTYNVSKHTWYDHGAERGGSTLELIAYSKGQPDEKLRGRAFLDMWKALAELGVGAPAPKPKDGDGKGPPILRTFPYHDENNVLLFEVVRFDVTDPDARFKQRRPDGKGGWIWDLEGVPRPLPLYRLPELIAAVKAGQRVFVTEGERDVHSAIARGYAGTTMCGGVGKWRKEHDEFFRGADVVIVSDNDPQLKDPKTGELKFHPDGRPVLPGQDHAAKLAKRLVKVAARVRTIMFEVKDLTAWVEAGGTREQLDALIEQAPEQVKQPTPEDEKEEDDEELDVDAEIERLMGLSDLEYERQKRGAAKKLGVSVSYLDRLRKAERAKTDNKPGQAISFPKVEPWPDEVNGSALLAALAETIAKHIIMPAHCRDLCALWVVHSYIFRRFMISPKLWVRSIVRGSGKTTLLDVLKHLVCRPYTTESITKAALFRIIDAYHPTLLIDEVDRFVGEDEELIGLLNASHRYDGTVTRTVGDDFEVRGFSVYSAIALSGIGGLAATLADRSIITELQRRRASEQITPLRIGRTGHLEELRRRIVRWVADHEGHIAERDPVLPLELFNRGGDNWMTILAIADEAGGEWSERGRQAALTANAHATVDDSASLTELLLRDIRDVFAEQSGDLMGEVTIGSADLADDLVAKLGRPWAEMGRSRKPLTQNRLARMLKPLAIAPEQIKFGSQDSRKGYRLNHFREAFNRLLGENWASQPINRNPRDEMGTSGVSQPKPAAPEVSVAKCEKPNNDGLGFGVSVAKGEKGVSGAKARVEIIQSSDGMPLYTGPVVDVPNLGPDPLDAHGASADPGLSADRRRELAEWRRKWIADGEKPEDVDDALRMMIREEVADPSQLETVMAAVLAGV
jgi:putative DNA primase/helicase